MLIWLADVNTFAYMFIYGCKHGLLTQTQTQKAV